jgi:hypothetical protein
MTLLAQIRRILLGRAAMLQQTPGRLGKRLGLSSVSDCTMTAQFISIGLFLLWLVVALLAVAHEVE